jgi:hypothetical protein
MAYASIEDGSGGHALLVARCNSGALFEWLVPVNIVTEVT